MDMMDGDFIKIDESVIITSPIPSHHISEALRGVNVAHPFHKFAENVNVAYLWSSLLQVLANFVKTHSLQFWAMNPCSIHFQQVLEEKT